MDTIARAEVPVQEIEPERGFQLPSRRTLLAVVIAAAIAIAGVAWIKTPPASESTDDAYVGADATTVAPKVRGLIAEIYVSDNQSVKAGQALVRIDPEEFDAKVAAAAGESADAEAHLASARAALLSLDAEERLAAADVVAARTSIRSALAESARSAADRRRYEDLVDSGAVARSDADRFSTAAVTAEQSARRAQALLAVAEEAAAVTRARRPGLTAAVQIAQARILQTAAALDLAKQDRRHTTIDAAIDGVVGNRQARVGDYVQAGSRLMTLVPLGQLYVTANFKETQTERMRAGQAVTIEADALPGVDIKGRVESLAPGSGSMFSLLPYEPGTGNFTKIVQRVPVRIRFDSDQPALSRLRPGLSVTARVRLQDR